MYAYSDVYRPRDPETPGPAAVAYPKNEKYPKKTLDNGGLIVYHQIG